MKGKHRLCAGSAFAAFFVGATALFMAGISVHRHGTPIDPEDNNPQKFHLWTTGSNFSYTFTCDPHASDIWMFRTAEGTMLVLPRGPDAPPVPTNARTNR